MRVRVSGRVAGSRARVFHLLVTEGTWVLDD